MRLLIVSQRLYYAREAQIFKISRTDRIEMHSSTPFVFFFFLFFFFFFQLNLVVKDRNQREIETDYIFVSYIYFPARAPNSYVTSCHALCLCLSHSHMF